MAMQKLLLLAFMFMACTVVVIYSRPMIDTSDIVKDIRDIENILNESDTDNSDDDDDEETKDSDDDDDKDEDKSDSAASESSDAAPKDKADSEGAPTIKNATDVGNATDEGTASAEPSNTTSADNTTATAAPAADSSAADPGKSDAARKDHIGIGQRLTSEQKDTDPEPESPSAANEFAKINPPESETSAAAPPAPATAATSPVKDAKTAPLGNPAPLGKTEKLKEGEPLADSTTKQSKEEVRVSEKAPSTEDKSASGSTNELKETSTHATSEASPKEEESSEQVQLKKKDEQEVPGKSKDNAVSNKTVDAEESDDDDEEEGEGLTNTKPETVENSESASDEETDDARTAAQTESKSDDVEDVEPENEDDRVKMFFISPYEREEAAPETPAGAERPTVRQILTYPATNGHGWGHSHQWGPSHIWNSDYPYYAYGYSWGCGGHGDANNHNALKKSNIKAKSSGKEKSDSKSDKKTKVKSKSTKKGKKSETTKKTDWICRDYMLVPATPRGPLMDPSVVDIERGSARHTVYSKDVACTEEDQQCKARQVIGSMAGGSLFGDGMGGLGMGFPGVPGIHAGLSGYNEMGGFGDHPGYGGCAGGHCGGGAGFGGGYGGGQGVVGRFFGERNFWGERQHAPQYIGRMYGLENSVKKSNNPKKTPYPDYNVNVVQGALGYGNDLSGYNTRPLYNEGFGEPVPNAGAENQNFFGSQGWGNAGGSFVRQGNEFGNWAPNAPENGGNFMVPYGAGNGVEPVNGNGVDSYFGGKELPPGTPYIGNGNDYGVGRTVHSVMNAEAQGKLGLSGKISINGIHKNFSYKSKIRKHKDKKEKPATARQDIAMPDEQAMMEITKQRQLIGSLGASTLFADNVGGMGLGHPGVPQMSSGISGIPGEYGGTGGYSHGWNGEDQPGINPHGFRHYAYGNQGLERGDQEHGSVYQPHHSVTDSAHRRTQILAADPIDYNSRVNQQLVEAAQASQMTPQKMSEIERMVHDVSDSIDRTNRKLMAITANNGKRQITPAFTPVVSEPAAVPDIRYPVPAADRYPLGAGYIWPSANYGHQLGGPFAWSKSSTPTAEKTNEKPKTEKKATSKSKVDKKDSKTKVESKKHKKAIKDHSTHVKKERRSVEKSNSTGSEKTGTKRQFLAHPYERSSENYPYHGGLDPQQSEQATGDPSSFAPMIHNQMPQGMMPQMVPEPQPGMFSPNLRDEKIR